MSATLSSSNPELFSTLANMADVMEPNYPETDTMIKRWTNYISYAGTYDIDIQNQNVIHHVEVSMFPNNVGHDQVRAFTFGKEIVKSTTGGVEDTLQLSATFLHRTHVLLWKREVVKQECNKNILVLLNYF